MYYLIWGSFPMVFPCRLVTRNFFVPLCFTFVSVIIFYILLGCNFLRQNSGFI